MAKCTVSVKISLPWWWRIYFNFARLNVMLGIPVDPETVVETICSRAKVTPVLTPMPDETEK
jgi:hypothetical protein